MKFKLIKGACLVPGTFIYNSWLNLPIQLRTNFYLFNLVNPDEFVHNGALPEFEEIGPFVYDEIRIKENVTLNSNGTISYRERRRFFFNSDLSVQNDSVQITSINMVIVTSLNLLRSYSFLDSKIIKFVFEMIFKMNNESLLVTKSVNQLLFGYDDKLMSLLAEFKLVSNDKIAFFINVGYFLYFFQKKIQINYF